MSNIKINNTRKLSLRVRKDDYWDLMLSKDETYGTNFDLDDTECLAAWVDTSNVCLEYFADGKVFSKVSWGGAVNSGDDEMSGVTLYNAGFCGVDNGLVFYDKNLIDNAQFLGYYTASHYCTCADTRLNLSVTRCNTGEHIYPIKVATDDSSKYFECKGGWLQGFYKTYGYDYQVLPHVIEDEWDVSFTMRPRADYEIQEGTLNEEHPKNKGIFFYLGMRAENKFWDMSADDEMKKKYFIPRYNADGYDAITDPTYQPGMNCGEDFWFLEDNTLEQPTPEIPDVWSDGYIVEGYEKPEGTVLSGCPDPDAWMTNYVDNDFCGDDSWVEPGFRIEEINLDGIDVVTANGHRISENTSSYYEITSNNKYLLFNSTCSGYTVEKWEKEDGEHKTFIFTAKRPNPKIPNYYLLFNQTCTGYTTSTIGEYLKSIEEPYDIYSDYLRNAFALKYNDDGSITYKYVVRDLGSACPEYDFSTFEGEYITEDVKVIEETTLPGLVKDGQWSNVHLRFRITGGDLQCGKSSGQRKMKIYLYVNGLLKFISRPIPEFNFKPLAEVSDKQEGVPYNISIGGGTQGLADTVGLDFLNYTQYELPLEKCFGGSFLGDIKVFRFYACPLSFGVINRLKNKMIG